MNVLYWENTPEFRGLFSIESLIYSICEVLNIEQTKNREK